MSLPFAMNTNKLHSTLTLPKGFMPGVQLTSGRNGRIIAAKSDDAMKMKYERAVRDAKLIGDNYFKANSKRIDYRVELLKKDLGIAVPSETGASLSLKEKMKVVGSQVYITHREYIAEWDQRVEGSRSDETLEEVMAWEIFEKKLLEYGELMVEMYNLRPGMTFGPDLDSRGPLGIKR